MNISFTHKSYFLMMRLLKKAEGLFDIALV